MGNDEGNGGEKIVDWGVLTLYSVVAITAIVEWNWKGIAVVAALILLQPFPPSAFMGGDSE